MLAFAVMGMWQTLMIRGFPQHQGLCIERIAPVSVLDEQKGANTSKLFDPRYSITRVLITSSSWPPIALVDHAQ